MQILDKSTGLSYQALRVSLERWQCGRCNYAYLIKDMTTCPNCQGLIINDFMQAAKLSKPIVSPSFGEWDRLQKKQPDKPKWDLTKVVDSYVAFAYIERNWKEDYMTAPNIKKQVYNIRIESPFILTQRQIKEKLGIGFNVVSVETEKDIYVPNITDTDSAVAAIIHTGYRALARANHPDLGGDVEIMTTINRAKKELVDLLESLKGI